MCELCVYVSSFDLGCRMMQVSEHSRTRSQFGDRKRVDLTVLGSQNIPYLGGVTSIVLMFVSIKV